MEFYISPQSGQFYMINVLENQWLSVTLSVHNMLYHWQRHQGNKSTTENGKFSRHVIKCELLCNKNDSGPTCTKHLNLRRSLSLKII